MYKFAYAIILKENGCCIQNIRTNKSGWGIETSKEFSVEIPVNSADDYLDKFYHDGKWWERIWNDDHTEYEDIIFTPDEVE